MPVVRVLLVLFSGLLLSAPAVRAQQTAHSGTAETKPASVPPTRREQRVLTMHLPLPMLVARLGEAVGLLERPAPKNSRTTAATPVPANPVLVITLPLPKLFSTQAADSPAPSTP